MHHPLTILYTPLPQGSIHELSIWRCAFEAALAPWLEKRQMEHVRRFGRVAVQAQTAAAALPQNAGKTDDMGAEAMGQEVMEAALSRLLARAQLITAAASPCLHPLLHAEKKGPLPCIHMDSRGRPLLDGWQAAFSHSGRAAFCALAPAGKAAPTALGLDAEAVISSPPDASAFAAGELSAPSALPRNFIDREAMRRWTIKEAMLKATGLGLGMQPAQIPTGRFGQRAGIWRGPLGPLGWRSVACPGHWLCVAQAGHVAALRLHLRWQGPRSLLRHLADLQPQT